MAVSSAPERLDYGGSDGSLARGLHREVIKEAVATRTLLAEESNSLCCFDRAAGVVYTLPAPIVGMQFEFVTTVTITSNAAKVITNAASVFLIGGAAIINSGAATGQMFAGNGTTHIATSSNGSTTGGIIGDRLRFTAVSSTLWVVDAVLNGTGTVATPFSTT